MSNHSMSYNSEQDDYYRYRRFGPAYLGRPTADSFPDNLVLGQNEYGALMLCILKLK